MSNRAKLPAGARRAPVRKFPKWARSTIEETIERLLAVLDLAEPDPDLEDDGTAEDADPAEDNDEDVDVVDQPHDVADEGDYEPSLGSPNPRCEYQGGPYTSQERWAEGPRDDSEDEHDGREPPEDDEPSMGWTASGAGRFSSGVDEEEDSLGSTNSINQTRWSAGKPGDYEAEHDGREPDEDFEIEPGQ